PSHALSLCPSSLLFLLLPESACFPYTTLFRSEALLAFVGLGAELVRVPNAVDLRRREVRLEFIEKLRDAYGAPSGREQTQNGRRDRKSTRLNSSHVKSSYAVFCLKTIINSTST